MDVKDFINKIFKSEKLKKCSSNHVLNIVIFSSGTFPLLHIINMLTAII